jgi:hypothetical protein
MSDSKAVLQAFTLGGSRKRGTSETLLTCASPVCREGFRQTGIMRLEPRRFCDAKCRQNAWVLRRAAKLLEGLSDKEKLRALK